MARILSLFVVILLVSTIIHAQGDVKTFVGSITLPESAQSLSEAERSEYVANHTLIIIGEDADLIERSGSEFLKASNPWLYGARQVDGPADTEGYLVVVLVGGPEHNTQTKLMQEWLDKSADMGLGLTMLNGHSPEGTILLAISDEQGFKPEKGMGGIPYSPLYGIVPPGTEPAAATTISLLLLALMNIARTVFEFKTLEYGRKGKKVGEDARIIAGINISEVGALVAASTVLGISLSWQFFGPTMDFLNFIVINSLICLMAALIHEITHRTVGRRFGIKVEYRFWKAGSALTLLSSYLGNAFSIQGFVLEEIAEGTERWKIGLMKLSAPMVSAFCMIGFAALFLLSPDPLLRTAYTTSALWAMAEILPLRSLDGADIKRWNPMIWLGAFAFISISYVAVMFFI